MANANRFWDRRMETMSRDELQVVQDHRLQWQIRRCWAGSAFYREHLGKAGLEPADVSGLDQLARIPILRPEELAEDRRAHPPDGRAAVAPREAWLRREDPGPRDPGTASAVWTEADRVNSVSLATRALWAFGARPSGSMLLKAGPAASPTAVDAIAEGARKIGLAVRRTDEPLVASRSAPSTGAGAAVLVEWREGHLSAIWAGAADRAEGDGGSAASPRPFRACGTPALGPTVAAECEARVGWHWMEDHVIVETLDPERMEPVRPGEVGLLVLTHLTREGSPLLRYWTGDYGRLELSACICGRTHARSPGGVVTTAAALRP
jgi:phenylacetate-CoA ligase